MRKAKLKGNADGEHEPMELLVRSRTVSLLSPAKMLSER